tara:strand:- start:311 stop:460 length:150 start_codon:yes stop_codon:yes gene_type:complete
MICKTRMTREEQQKWRLKMLRFWEENLEVRLAGIKASRAKLEEQMSTEE